MVASLLQLDSLLAGEVSRSPASRLRTTTAVKSAPVTTWVTRHPGLTRTRQKEAVSTCPRLLTTPTCTEGSL